VRARARLSLDMYVEAHVGLGYVETSVTFANF